MTPDDTNSLENNKQPGARDETDPSPQAASPNDPEDPLNPETPETREKRSYPATIGLIGLIVAAYGISTYPGFSHPSDMAMMLGSFYPPAVAQGEYWRFLTATLLHADLNHLFNNAFGILIFGQLLEPVIGPARMIRLYFISGLLGLVFSYFFLPNSVTIGASAIDYGLIGAYFAIILMIRYRMDKAVFRQELRSTIIFVVLFVAWNTLQLQQVNLWAHLGGFLGGLLFAFRIWRQSRFRMESLRNPDAD